MILPNFIGIGAPKAGTTWLAKCLGEHPDVFMAAMKETEFFKFVDYEQRLGEYAVHFTDAKHSHAVGEFSVRYLSLPGVPERIRRQLPNARLIVCLRNPVEQVYSNYWHLQRQNFNLADVSKVPRSIEEALKQHREFLLTPARYACHLKRWFLHFPREQLLTILFDDIQQRPTDVLRRAYVFLDVAPDFQPPSAMQKDSSVRQGTSPRGETSAHWHQTLYGGLVRGIYTPMKRLMGVRNAARIKDALRVRTVMERLFMRKGYPAMSPQTRALLQKEFAAEVAELAELTGLNLDSWK